MNQQRTLRYHVKRREFLNEDPAMPGFVIGIVQDTSSIPDKSQAWRHGTIMLDLGDCYRRVSFSFDLSEEITRRESLRKINVLAEVVNAVRDAIEKEVESCNARPHKVTTDSQTDIAISVCPK
jgi:hypothetical protein